MRVAALYRYPVKGFSAESCDVLQVLGDGRIAGDRVLGLRYANAVAGDEQWGTKHECLALVNTPGLARLSLKFDHQALRLRVTLQDKVLVETGLDDAGRKRFAAVIEEYALGLDENPLTAHPDRLPLRLVGDGHTSRYQDDKDGYVTLHGRDSLKAVAEASGVAELSELRFRSNIAVEGLPAWEEQAWVGRRIRIGAVNFEVVCAKDRCLATHANPATGQRDLTVMRTLRTVFPAEKPTFAVALTTANSGGAIRVGDKVELCD